MPEVGRSDKGSNQPEDSYRGGGLPPLPRIYGKKGESKCVVNRIRFMALLNDTCPFSKVDNLFNISEGHTHNSVGSAIINNYVLHPAMRHKGNTTFGTSPCSSYGAAGPNKYLRGYDTALFPDDPYRVWQLSHCIKRKPLQVVITP